MLQMFGPNLIIGTTMNSLHLVSLGNDSDKLPLNGAVIDATPVTQVNSVYSLFHLSPRLTVPITPRNLLSTGEKR